MRPEDLSSRIASLAESGVIELDAPLDLASARALAMNLQQQHHFHVHLIELSDTDQDVEQTLLQELDRGFQFPEYFGQNWNAVDECINDLSWLPADGYCCIALNCRVLEENAGQAAEVFIEVMLDASVQWAKAGKRFCLVLSR